MSAKIVSQGCSQTKKITRSRYALVIYDLDFLPRTEPQVVTQYGTQYVRTILIGGGMSPNIMVSK